MQGDNVTFLILKSQDPGVRVGEYFRYCKRGIVLMLSKDTYSRYVLARGQPRKYVGTSKLEIFFLQ